MKFLWTLIPFSLGLIAVLQGGLNRKVGDTLGLAYAVALNAAVLLSTALCLIVVLRVWPGVSLPTELARGHLSRSPQWWFLIPGLCGFCIVTGIPMSIGKVGALTVFVGVVGGQVVGSALWDILVENQSLPWTKIGAAVLALLAVILSGWTPTIRP